MNTVAAANTTVAVRTRVMSPAEAVRAEVLPVAALPAEAHPGAVTGGALPPWIATRYGVLPAKAAGPIMKKEVPMDMTKAGAGRAAAHPVAAAIGIVTGAALRPEAVQAEALPVAAAPPGARRIAEARPATAIRPGIPRGISPAAAGAQDTAAVRAAAAGARVAAVDVPVATAAPGEGRAGARFFHTCRQIEPVKTLFVCSLNINKSTLP